MTAPIVSCSKNDLQSKIGRVHVERFPIAIPPNFPGSDAMTITAFATWYDEGE